MIDSLSLEEAFQARSLPFNDIEFIKKHKWNCCVHFEHYIILNKVAFYQRGSVVISRRVRRDNHGYEKLALTVNIKSNYQRTGIFIVSDNPSIFPPLPFIYVN